MFATLHDRYGRSVLVAGLVLVLATLWTVAATAVPDRATPFGVEGMEGLLEQPSGIETPPILSLTDPQEAMEAVIGRVADLQSDITEDNANNGNPDTVADGNNGGWEWTIATSSPAHTGGLSYSNLYGPIAKGVAYGYKLTGDARYLTTMEDVRDGWRLGHYTGDIPTDGVNYAQNSLFEAMVIMAETTLNGAWADTAMTLYDNLFADGYNGWPGGGTPTQWAAHIHSRRDSYGQPALAAWDVAAYIESAVALDRYFPGQGYDTDADDMANEIASQITGGLWNPADPGETYYEFGIIGAVQAYASAGVHQADMASYKDVLITFDPGVDIDGQGAAYAVMALSDYPATADTTGIAAFVEEAMDYLTSMVDANGNVDYGGSIWPEEVAEVLTGLYKGSGTVVVEPATDCLSTINGSVTIPVYLDRPDGAMPHVRGYSVTFELTGPIEIDGTPAAAIIEGSFLDSISPAHYEVLGSGPQGPFTVDNAILGSTCGAAGGGLMFSVKIKSDGVTDGYGVLDVTSVIVRDCLNAPVPAVATGATTVATVDETVPTEITLLGASQVKSGNDIDGTTAITLTWPAVETDAAVEVFRKGYGDYPEYDDGTGAVPTPLSAPANAVAEGWTSTGVVASGTDDEVAGRDFWYFCAFVTDTCGNVSTVSNMTGGTLNYHLGDTHDGANDCDGDNGVTINDISFLGTHYGATLGLGDPLGCLDVGPTTDYSVDALPTTDDVVQFEDLMMFAINFAQVSAQQIPSGVQDVPGGKARLELVLEPIDAELYRAHILLVDNPGDVKGIHAILEFGQAEMLGVERGELLDAYAGQIFFAHLPEGGVGIHAAILGQESTIHGQGEIASVLLRGRASTGARLALADLRSLGNGFLGDPPQATMALTDDGADLGAALPTRFELIGAEPNPFNPSTTIRFRLPRETQVSLRIYDVGGRLMRALVHGAMPAGEHGVIWDGRNSHGRLLGSGVYIYTLQAGELNAVEKLVLLK